MKNKGELILGVSILVFGGILLLGNLFQISIWRFFWPLLLIGLGVLILVRQQNANTLGTNTHFSFAKDINRNNAWEVSDAEFWHFFGDLDLDFTNTTIPEGVHQWQLFGIVHEIRMKVPENMGVSVTANAIVIENKIDGEKEDRILNPLSWESPNYESASNKFHIEATGIVCEVRVTIINQSTEGDT